MLWELIKVEVAAEVDLTIEVVETVEEDMEEDPTEAVMVKVAEVGVIVITP